MDEICAGDRKKRDLGEKDDPTDQKNEKEYRESRLAARPRNILKAVIAHGTGHQETERDD